MRDWKPIPEFPGYMVTEDGKVIHEPTGRTMALLRNQHEIVHVGMTKGKRQYKRALAPLVAAAFLHVERDDFTTPIHLDGDKNNCHADNLALRPKWFAVKYQQQFENDIHGVNMPIEDIKTGEQFETSLHAVVKYGILHKEIVNSIIRNSFVWPTFQRFRVVE